MVFSKTQFRPELFQAAAPLAPVIDEKQAIWYWRMHPISTVFINPQSSDSRRSAMLNAVCTDLKRFSITKQPQADQAIPFAAPSSGVLNAAPHWQQRT
jgi:hypothetical protein